ncbi:DNA-binding transcriptional ArsR family regulator [Arthrobacter silviterrae]|uniref:Helix-turn-helix transcriptional regulator n=1 Tax=Arthrobacter silviterrae TaxID=2026658 RepID=A0ABX0DGD1_9MICC|nr:helix-turn-helix transcriptional regulator [Arthrobacter silviterrae]MDQ0276562.1 DNA-binding transcriptional ArsR family regulator [Arthrobacter silviterrae]NGN84816.1 helix-turn-helix transcriptional regulator [Arthrobacter silviterrae]
MPKITHPVDLAWTPDVEASIEAFGNRARVEIIRYLKGSGPVPRGDIVDAVSASEASVAQHLIALEKTGAITVDIVQGRRHGRSPRYSVAENRIKELLAAHQDYLLNRPPNLPQDARQYPDLGNQR